MINAYVVVGAGRYAIAIQEMTADGIHLRSFSGDGGWEEAWEEVLKLYSGDIAFVLPPGEGFDAVVNLPGRMITIVSAPDIFTGFFQALWRRLEK